MRRLEQRQDRVVHRRQLLQAGVTPDALRWRVRTGRWQRLLPGVYGLFSGRPTRKQQVIAAHLYAGPRSRVAGLTALELFGMRYAPKDSRIHLAVPRACRIRSAGFVKIQRSDRADDHPLRHGNVPVSSVARATADAARCTRSLRDVRALVAETVQCRLATVARLRQELDDGPRRGSAHLRLVLDELQAGVRSAPEAELRRLMKTSRILPEALWNPTLVDAKRTRLPTPDAYLPDALLALEVDSKAHHTSPEDWERTMRRHNRLAAHGVLVLHFSPARIRGEPRAVLAEIERAFCERLSPRARPRSRGRPVASRPK